MKKPWGSLFTARGAEPHVLADVIEQRLSRYQMQTSREVSPNGTLLVRGVQQCSWVRVLVRKPPQQLLWELRPGDKPDETVVRFDRRWSPWFRFVVWTFAPLVGWGWVSGFSSIFHLSDDPSALSVGHLLLPWLGVSLMFLLTHLVITDTGTIRLLEDLRADLRQRGAVLDPVLPGGRDRKTTVGTLLLVYVGVLSLLILFGANLPLQKLATPGGAALAILVLAALAMVGAALRGMSLGVRRAGADDRFAPLVPSLLSAIFVLSLLGGQIPFGFLGKTDTEIWENVFQARQMWESGVDPVPNADGTPVPRDELQRRLSIARIIFCIPLSVTALMWAVGVFMLVMSIRSAAAMVRITQRIAVDTQGGSESAAASGRGYLRSFRKAYIAIWILYAGLVLGGIGFSVVTLGPDAFGASAFDTDPQAPVGQTSATAHTLELLLGMELGSPLCRMIVRMFFIALVSLLPVSLLISTAHFVWYRRRLHKLLTANPSVAAVTNTGTPITTIVDHLAKKAGCEAPQVVVIPDRRIVATAQAFGFMWRKRLLVVSSGTLDALDDAQVEALLAHEMSHHLRGHCRRHYGLQLLGRMTFMGGSFVGALEDSFGYELEADRTAVTRLGIRPSALKNCLSHLRAAALFQRSEATFDSEALGFLNFAATGRSASLAGTSCGTSWRARLVQSLRSWTLLYTADTNVAYWHPSIEKRIAELDHLDTIPDS